MRVSKSAFGQNILCALCGLLYIARVGNKLPGHNINSVLCLKWSNVLFLCRHSNGWNFLYDYSHDSET